jgi:hypothetical protein
MKLKTFTITTGLYFMCNAALHNKPWWITYLIKPQHRIFSEPGGSVSIMSGYGLDDRAIQVRSPEETKDFSSSLCVQTGSEAHPASCTMGTGGPFPGAWRWPLTPSVAEFYNE